MEGELSKCNNFIFMLLISINLMHTVHIIVKGFTLVVAVAAANGQLK